MLLEKLRLRNAVWLAWCRCFDAKQKGMAGLLCPVAFREWKKQNVCVFKILWLRGFAACMLNGELFSLK